MFDRRMMLSYLDGLITESERKQMKKVEQLRAKGTEKGEAAAKEIITKREKRFGAHLKLRADVPEVKRDILKRKGAKQEQKRTSHGDRLEKAIDKISDQILDRIGTKDPERREELKPLKAHREKLKLRLKKVAEKIKAGEPSKREERKRKKEGPDLH